MYCFQIPTADSMNYSNLINHGFPHFNKDFPTCIVNINNFPTTNSVLPAIMNNLNVVIMGWLPCPTDKNHNMLILYSENIAVEKYFITKSFPINVLIYIDTRDLSNNLCDKFLKYIFTKPIILIKNLFTITFCDYHLRNEILFYEIWNHRLKFNLEFVNKRISSVKSAHFNKRVNLNLLPIQITTLRSFLSPEYTGKMIPIHKHILTYLNASLHSFPINYDINIEDEFDYRFMHTLQKPMGFNVRSACFVVQKGKNFPEWQALARCFHWHIWLCLLVAWLFSGLVWHRLKANQSLDKSFTDILSLYVTYPVIWFHSRTKNVSRTLSGILVMSSIIIISGLLQSLLYSNLQSPGRYEPINTLEELQKANLTIYCKNYLNCERLFDNIIQDISPIFHQLVKQLAYTRLSKIDKLYFIFNRSAFDENIDTVYMHSDRALIINCNEAIDLINTIPKYKKNLHIVDERITINPSVIYSQFTPPYFDHIVRILFTFHESGIAQWWDSHEQWKQQLKRLFQEKELPRLKVFSLKDLEIAFFILIFGNFIGFVAFIFEYKNYLFKFSY